jgi:hypothetical protein
MVPVILQPSCLQRLLKGPDPAPNTPVLICDTGIGLWALNVEVTIGVFINGAFVIFDQSLGGAVLCWATHTRVGTVEKPEAEVVLNSCSRWSCSKQGSQRPCFAAVPNRKQPDFLHGAPASTNAFLSGLAVELLVVGTTYWWAGIGCCLYKNKTNTIQNISFKLFAEQQARGNQHE